MDKELVRQRIRKHAGLLFERDLPKFKGKQFTDERSIGPLRIAEFSGGITLTVSDEHRYALLIDERGNSLQNTYLTVSAARNDWHDILHREAHRYHVEMLEYAKADLMLSGLQLNSEQQQQLESIALQESHKLMWRLTGNTLRWRIRRAITCLNRMLPKRLRSLAYRYYGLNATLDNLNFCWYHQELLESLPVSVATAFAHYARYESRAPTTPEQATQLVHARLSKQKGDPFTTRELHRSPLSPGAWQLFINMTSQQARLLAQSDYAREILEALARADAHPRTSVLQHLILAAYHLRDQGEQLATYAGALTRHTAKMRKLRLFLDALGSYVYDYLRATEGPFDPHADFQHLHQQASEWHQAVQQSAIELIYQDR